MSRLALYLLGPPRIELDGEPVQVGRRKMVALLAYLAVAGGCHRRDSLATLLWPEYDQSRALAYLRRILSMLNRVLDGGWLAVDRGTAGLNADAGLWLDVDVFRQRLVACGTHGHPPTEVCTDCVPLLEEAVGLYRDDFLAGFTLRDSALFDEWQFFQTEGLRRELASALERMVRGYAAQGDYGAAIPYARRWLALDPLHEPAHRCLMALYARTGQQSAALRQYQLCEQTLAEELGLPPSEETAALYERIRSGAEVGREREAAAPPHRLPLQPTPFVGREEELAHIARRLDDPDCRLLTVVGPGGIGKTRLAIQAAQQIIETPPDHTSFAHGVYLVPLVAVSTPDALVPTIASALDFSFYRGADPKKQLLDYLREKKMLLLLDNFEHLLEGVDLVTELLVAAPGVKILVTSREALNLQQEWFHPVEGMPFPPPDAVEGEEEVSLQDYAAVALFLQCARRARPGFSLAEEGHWVVHICQLVEGMPLAIELAAAWLKALPTPKIAEQLERGLDILSTSMRDLPVRHRSMRAVFDHSWNLLTPRQRAVMQALSVFRGSFNGEAAQAVAGASWLILARLVEKSMLSTTPTDRYQMHELLRQYAAEKLHEAPRERERTHNRHSEYFAAFLQECGEALKGPEQQAVLEELEADVENARAAWDWAVEQGQVERLDQAMEGLCRTYEWRGRCQEGEAACRMAAEKLRVTVSDKGLRVWAKTLAWQGVFDWLLGRSKPASRLLRQSLALLKRPELADQDTRSEQAFVLLQMGNMTLSSNREEAKRLLGQSLTLYQALGDQWGTANVLGSLGGVAEGLGVYGEAKELREGSLAIRRALGDQSGIADSVLSLGWIALLQGRLEEAERLTRESLAIRQEIGGRTSIAEGRLRLGVILFWLGKFAEANSLLEESVAVYNDLRFARLAWSNTLLGITKAHLGQYEQARVQGQLSLTLHREIGDRAGIGHSLLALGHIVLAVEAYAEAQQLLRESVAVYQEIGQLGELCWALSDLGLAALRLGDISQAQQHLFEALRTSTEIRFGLTPMFALSTAALIRQDQGRKEQAVELYALASRYPFVANSRWFEDVAGKHIAAVAATLPPDVVAAAQERGRARDLEATVAELLAGLEE